MKTPLFAHITALTYLLPTLSGIYCWKRLPKPLKVFAVFFIYTVLHEIATFTLGKMGIYNQFLINYYQLVEIECFLFLYYIWTKNQKIKDLLQYAGLFYLIFWLINKLYYEDPAKFNNVIAAIAYFILIAVSIIILRNALQNTNAVLTEQPMFWIGSGILLYSSFTIIVQMMSNYFLELGISYFTFLWHINWGATIIANLFFARSFWCRIY